MEDESLFLGMPRRLAVAEQVAVNAALDKLEYGKFDSKAAEVEQQVRAEFRKRQALQGEQGKDEVEES